MHVFFEDETLDFQYIVIAEVSTIGNIDDDTESVLKELHQTAYENGANGIIEIEQSYKSRSVCLSQTKLST